MPRFGEMESKGKH